MTQRVTVLDGGMGRELLRIGAPFRQPEWSALALLEGPDWVVQAHGNFIDAGAEVITTNSYAVVPFHLGEERFAAQGRELASLSGALARTAADSSSHPVQVAGCLPPLFGSYRPDLFDAERAADLIDPLVDGLTPHVDLWLAETLSSIAEAVAVRAALTRAGGRAGGLPLWVSFTLDDAEPGRLRSGETVHDACHAVIDLGATAVLFNCSQAETITTAVGIAVGLVGDLAVGAYANRFVAGHSANGEANAGLSAFRDDLDPAQYGEFVRGWIGAGVSIIGGCCGMEPDHVAEIARAVASPDSEPMP